MQKLPEEFTNRIKRQLGDEYEAFLAGYGDEAGAGLRANTEKISAAGLKSRLPFPLEPIPWAENGFYYRKGDPVAKHPYYHAGLYYIQEPSAMLPASRLPVCPGDVVLDLCAAPGGKATELSSRLGGTGLLVANDVSASRARALLRNLSLWGSRNACVTAETPQRLLDAFGCFFDKILVDAPCSGEGMFRRDSRLIGDWEERGPQYYAPLQRGILSCAVRMLRPGGMLLYSTCTFSEEEDEAVIEDLLENFPELLLLEPEPFEGMSHGRAPCERTLRLWPHRVRGEGHFLALLKKQGGGGTASRMVPEPEVRRSHRKMPGEVRDFLEKLPRALWENCIYEQRGELCILRPPYRLPEKLRYLRTGLVAGSCKKGRFEPSQALAMALSAASYPDVLDLPCDDPRIVKYLRGETIEPEEADDSGGSESAGGSLLVQADGRAGSAFAGGSWILVCTDGYALGWGKYVNGSIRNKYEPGWRLQ